MFQLFSRISGVTGVELSAGLHWYIKHWCGAHVSWDKTGGLQLSSVPKPGSLPRVQDSGILIQRPIPWHYYQNAVTSSCHVLTTLILFSFICLKIHLPGGTGKDGKRRLTGWLYKVSICSSIHRARGYLAKSISGIVLSLGLCLDRNFNISSSDLNDFFGGPAFPAWARMGNLHGWGGPLPQTWLDQQLTLQKKILARMFEFGMTPVLPAFSGNVPAALKTIFPSASITRLANWFTVGGDSRWCCTFLLDATDPLFVEIGKAFVQEQSREYGRTSHIYNCDSFDENTPPVDDPDYISSLGAAIYRGMQSGDENAVWLMQGWLFSYDPFWKPPQMKSETTKVNEDNDEICLIFKHLMLSLKCVHLSSCTSTFCSLGKISCPCLFAEVKPLWPTSDQFYGIPYIWQLGTPGFSNPNPAAIILEHCKPARVQMISGACCRRCMLNNYARNSEMYGVLDAVGSGPVEARMSKNSTMASCVGMSMEGIEQNPVAYDNCCTYTPRTDPAENC
ncbi:hypothetical protein RHMOL_Rhmol08G0229400 [Rhododendron molle]|uniref:Uncharacterized protein n=1 Tax=Rhododendron molle TaxID=49168 RepID=A0ACC0MSG6_RHOML|nr:hypothetical protein RHMOL_Rhmol08G0229400 [Rhododendron molle]